MALHHAVSGEIIDVRPLGSDLSSTTTRALYKSAHLELFRMVLAAGKTVPSHKVAGEITVQCLEGSIEFKLEGSTQVMRQGDLMCLAGAQPHSLTALEPSSVLVTILLHSE